jgi:non-lysosomal glucosylceramidase
MRRTEYLIELEPGGMMPFRAFKAFGSTWLWKGSSGPPAADGQLGSIMRVYREWKLSGDEAFLRELWPGMKRSLAFALSRWDPDGDLVLEAEHHTSYDIELYGPNTLSGAYLLGALKAMAALASFLGEAEYASGLEAAFSRASARLDELCWDGEYYVQRLADLDEHKYQYGQGCLSDQLVAQLFARISGLGHLLPGDHVRTALRSVYKYNFRESFAEHHNCQRSYAINDEAGLLLCSWPKGGRPRFPFVYSDETWPGSEYAVAANLVFEGFVDEALAIVKAVQDRHDGVYRNPWNEIECGNHYARSLSSWALLIAFSGFSFDLAKGEIGFAPQVGLADFTTFWSVGTAWGSYSQRPNGSGGLEPELKVLYGDASGLRVRACGREWVVP